MLKMKQKEVSRQKQGLLDIEEVLKEIEAKTFKSMKLRPIQRPKTKDGELLDPALPMDLTQINDVKLGRVYGEFAAMCAYIQLHLGLKQVEQIALEKLDKVTRAKVKMEKAGNTHEKAAKMEMDRRVRETTRQALIGEGTYVITDALLKSYTIGLQALSREMSRRKILP